MRIAALVAAGVLLTLAATYYLTYEPSPRVGIQWRPGITAERRAELERRFRLVNPGLEDGRPMYDLLDTSRQNLEALVNERDVADTDRVSRERFEIPFDVPYGTSWMWAAHRTPIVRVAGAVPVLVSICLLLLVAGTAAEWRRWRGRR